MPPGRQQRDCAIDQPALQAGERGDVGRRLEPWHVGVAADGAGRGARRIEQHGVEFLVRRPFGDVGADQIGVERQPGEILRKPFEPRGGAIDRGDAGPGGGELRGLAAGRGAEIGNAPAANLAEQPRRQRRRRVLHPPRAFDKAGQRGHRAMRDGAHRAGRQHPALELARPSFGVAFYREIERRFTAVRRGNGARGRRAVSVGPSRQ